jgi:hypothetical protein
MRPGGAHMPVPSNPGNREAEVIRFKPIEVPNGNFDLFDTHLMRAFMFKWGMTPRQQSRTGSPKI